MPGIQKSVRLPEETLKEIQRMVRETGMDFSAVTKDLLREAIKIRRCPGILFTDGVNGRRARIAGSGIEVWEVIATFYSVGKNLKRLQKAYHWLTGEQLQSALAYYSAYPEEIDSQIRKNKEWNDGKIKERYPYLNSPS
ncbi:MAG: DUF433 domain-containing protein [Deltaproteobacteria bacterium]|nr:DUF433 domain-containing protein [Deltaproteobacteria bacterium]